MAEAAQLPAQAAQRLLDGIDDAFEQALHGRYGGSVQAVLADGAWQDTPPQMLRVPPAGKEDTIQLFLQPQGGSELPALSHGVVVGSVTLSPPPGQAVSDVSVLTEIFDTRDANEAADASCLATGLLFAPGPNGGLCVRRSTEAGAASARSVRRAQRGFLPEQARHNPGRALGLSSNGHRRALPSSLALPVTAELLTRLGGAVALMSGPDEPGIGRMTLVVQNSADDMA